MGFRIVYTELDSRMAGKEDRERTIMAQEGEGGAMMDVLFWGFFGVGFLVMLAMIVSVFRSIWNGKRERDNWKELVDKSSILKR
jgi:uncharacterized membrane protein YoaT (DUF817 family)